MARKEKDKPLDPRSDNPSLNSELRAATQNQSSVTPEDYPAETRAMQTLSSRIPTKEASKKSGK